MNEEFNQVWDLYPKKQGKKPAQAAFIRARGREDLGLQLIAYHRMGAAKYAALDLPYLMGDLPAMLPEKADAVRAKYEALGVSCTVSR